MLCDICGEIIRAKKGALLDEDGTILCVHHTTGESFKRSAEDGCHICSVVWSRLAPSQQKCLLELETKNPITNLLMAGPEIVESSDIIDIFGTDSLILAFQFDLDEKIWDLPGGSGEPDSMFVLQPSEGLVLFGFVTPFSNRPHIFSGSLPSSTSNNTITQVTDVCICSAQRLHTLFAIRRQYCVGRILESCDAMA